MHLQNLNFKGIDHCGHLMLTRRSTGDVDQWQWGKLWIEVHKAEVIREENKISLNWLDKSCKCCFMQKL